MNKLFSVATVLALATGCGSNWDLEITVGPGCTDASIKAWWPDDDGDGWGHADDMDDPSASAVMACNGDEDPGLVRNPLDCDDLEEVGENELGVITGRVGAFCPEEIVYNPSDDAIQYVGARLNEVEFIAFYGTTPTDYGSTAQANCTFWGNEADVKIPKWMEDDDPAVVAPAAPAAQLATFGSLEEFAAVRDALDAAQPTGAMAAWVGLTVSDAGAWEWQDGSTGNGLSSIGFCGDAPNAEWYDRAALVRQTSGTWCLSAPDAAEGFDDETAHSICERVPPDAAFYNWHPLPGTEDVTE